MIPGNLLWYTVTMIDLTRETEDLARRLATAEHSSVDTVVRQALEARADMIGLAPARPQRRMSVAEILKAGGEVAAMPLLDKRTPRQITDDINALG
jgi:antitoxin VapB